MSSRFDLIVRGGKVVTPEAVARGDVGIIDGRFALIAEFIPERAAREIDGAGLHVFPGILDAHVHFNEPGRAEWEGLSTGPAALAAGGGTWFCDMPLNSVPPVLDAQSFARKRKLAEEKSVLDFALWGGLTPGNLDKLDELKDAGAAGLKAFMCASGVDEFPNVDARTLRAGMKAASRLQMIVAVHAEDDALAARHGAEARKLGAGAREWLGSRPVEVELEAIRVATEIAGETVCSLHVVHVSTQEGLELIRKASARGVDVTAETCPHYLLLNEEDVVRTGAEAKCAPPLRPETDRRRLWAGIEQDFVDTIGSDHSPAPPEMKSSDDFFSIWGGISGCQHGFPLLLSEAVAKFGSEKGLPMMSALLASNVAARFRLAAKGRLAEENDADFSLLRITGDGRPLDNADLLYRHRQGPYAGRACRVQVVSTFVRGRPVWSDGGIAPDAPRGNFTKPYR